MAFVSTVANSGGYNPDDSSGLLTFTYDEEYSTNGAHDPGAPTDPPRGGGPAVFRRR